MKKIFSTKIWGILTGVFTILFVAIIVLTYIATNMASAAINMMFGTSNFVTINDPDAEIQDFYKTSYDFALNGDNLYKEDSSMVEEAEGTGAVLLWNNNSALPVNGTEKVSLLGHSSVEIVECGTGSGYVEGYDYNQNTSKTVTMKQSFESRGFQVNPELWNFYANGDGSKYKMINWKKSLCTPWQQWTVNEVSQSVYTSDIKNSYSEYGDIAIVTLSRSGGEYSDLHYNYENSSDTIGANDKNKRENTSQEGGYLGLSNEEEELLNAVVSNKKSNVFSKVILLLNTGNPLQMQDLEKYYKDIDACMWIGQPGSTGMNAVCDLLKGKDLQGNTLTPSGRLADTWVYDNNSAPSTVNDGSYTYGNSNLITNGHGTASFANKYMVYQEGIYIGYRYYETRYYDSVTSNGNATASIGAKHSTNGWSYNEEVAFPFGYGLSYTQFNYSEFKVKHDKEYEVSVKVTNTGYTAGKEVVQLYLSKPYTDYDIENNIEKSAVELVGFDKTQLLQPGESETIVIKVPLDSFKTYDANGEQTYIIERGDYYLTIATDSHIASNNILQYSNIQTEKQIVFGGEEGTKSVNLGKDFVEKISLSKDTRTFSVTAQTGFEITNQLDSGDINKYANRGNNSVTYLSRNDWENTYPQSYAQLSLNSEMAQDLLFNIVPNEGDNEMPQEGVFESGSTSGIPQENDLVAIQFMDAPLNPELIKDKSILDLVYDDGLTYVDHWNKMWDQLLDQMNYDEQCNIVVNSYHWIHGAKSIALPESRQENGPVGITKRTETFFSLPNDSKIKGEDGTGWSWIAYPCAGILASSFDTDIAQRVGEHKSEDMLYLGYNGIYGPGVNMHRSPFGGRAFEYPSEDSYLAGYIEAYETKGIESKGCMAYAKHYALNDMETNRVNCGIWSNEQASREIYLRPFEIVFTVGKASATMNSFTRIGTKWNGASYAMMTTILRNEWGYDGLVISDWVTDGSAMSYLDGVMAGTDTFDGNGLSSELTKYSNNAAVKNAVRESVKRVIYNVVRTNAMNGMSITSRTIEVTPWWKTMLVTLEWTLGAIFVASAGMLIASVIIKVKTKSKKNDSNFFIEKNN